MAQNCPLCGEEIENRLSEVYAPARAEISGRCCVEASIDPLDELGDAASPKAVLTVYVHDGEATYQNDSETED